MGGMMTTTRAFSTFLMCIGTIMLAQLIGILPLGTRPPNLWAMVGFMLTSIIGFYISGFLTFFHTILNVPQVLEKIQDKHKQNGSGS